jgi:hypothetical protein
MYLPSVLEKKYSKIMLYTKNKERRKSMFPGLTRLSLLLKEPIYDHAKEIE